MMWLVTGLSAAVTVLGSEMTSDQLVIQTLEGVDGVDASDLPAGLIQLTINGAPDADVLVGSAGDDILEGENYFRRISERTGAE